MAILTETDPYPTPRSALYSDFSTGTAIRIRKERRRTENLKTAEGGEDLIQKFNVEHEKFRETISNKFQSPLATQCKVVERCQAEQKSTLFTAQTIQHGDWSLGELLGFYPTRLHGFRSECEAQFSLNLPCEPINIATRKRKGTNKRRKI